MPKSHLLRISLLILVASAVFFFYYNQKSEKEKQKQQHNKTVVEMLQEIEREDRLKHDTPIVGPDSTSTDHIKW